MGGENRNRQKRPSLTTPTPRSPRARERVEGMKAFPRDFAGAFRDNIRLLLERHCQRHRVSGDDDGALAAWRTTLVDEGTGQLFGLYFVEERVELSQTPFCDYCRCAGWSHHLVSRRRYHVIVPSIDEWDHCQLPENFIHSQTHLLHGLLHCNGFGHLLSIHGRSSGSHPRGRDLMDLWDHLCESLCIRSVSVEDVSANSLFLPLRLLYSLSHGQPWFARWGYSFSHGCYGITKSTYCAAVDFFSSLNIEFLLDELKDVSLVKDVGRIVTFYRQLSGKGLQTIRELFAYLVELRRMENYPPTAAPILSLPAPSARQRRQVAAGSYKRKRFQDFDKVAEKLESRWPVRRLRYAAEIIVDALREHGTLTRQEVRDAARRAIGDTGLIDFVVKSIGDTVVAGQIVRRTPHPRTRVLEFSVDVVDASRPVQAEEVKPLTWPSKTTIGRDIDTLHQSVIKGYWQEARVILDCKHWAKHWGICDDTDDNLRFIVEWQPMPWEMSVLRGTPLPGEVVVVEPHASVGDLVAIAEHAMQDTYCIMERFRAHSVVGLSGDVWEPVLSGGAESGARIGIIGSGVDLNSPLRYERGEDIWMVECLCGAREDDGEMMIACDVCATWHHMRCMGLADDQDTSSMFLCPRCTGTSLDAGEMPLVPSLEA